MSSLSWQFTPYTVPVLLAGTGTFVCATLLWRNGTRRSRYAALLLWDLTVWMTGYALELSGTTLPVKLAGQAMQDVAGVFISLAEEVEAGKLDRSVVAELEDLVGWAEEGP